jgi:hypothetical protein
MKKSEFKKLIREIVEIVEDEMPGGKGDSTQVADLDATELQKGIEVEMEHTDDSAKAKEIAIDHLTEDPKYYTKLDNVGLADELHESRVGDAYIELGEAIDTIDDEIIHVVKILKSMGEWNKYGIYLIPIGKNMIKLKNELSDSYEFKH